jgi:hypothetical protein
MTEVNLSRASPTKASRDLIKEGISYYLDAGYALYRFQVEIASLAQGVLRNKIGDLIQALGGKLPTADSIEPNRWPDNLETDYDGSFAWLGTHLWLTEPLSHGFDLGLSFERGDGDSVLVVACHTLPRKRLYNALKGLLAKRPGGFYDDPDEWCLGLSTPLQSYETIEAEFDKMMDQVIEFWTGVGGYSNSAT